MLGALEARSGGPPSLLSVLALRDVDGVLPTQAPGIDLAGQAPGPEIYRADFDIYLTDFDIYLTDFEI